MGSRYDPERLFWAGSDFFGFFGALKRGGLFWGPPQKTPKWQPIRFLPFWRSLVPTLPAWERENHAKKTAFFSRKFLLSHSEVSASIADNFNFSS
jgi:hypothetical protein